MTATFKYIHHACFTVTAGGETLICDPFLDGNPEGITMKDLKVDYIFITHAHGDHLGCAYELAKQCHALIITTAEIAAQAQEQGCEAHAMHLGGTFRFPFGKVRVTPAFHGSGIAGGHACGFIINFHGTAFYFAGDTALYSDMQLLRSLDPFRYALLPIGGNFTMDPHDAAKAACFLKAPVVIPIHYNTWPVITQDPAAFKKEVEAKMPETKVVIVQPGGTMEWD
jgi:L-ascorbate metabolism protein UlaG (beta-lactamase superfamily)